MNFKCYMCNVRIQKKINPVFWIYSCISKKSYVVITGNIFYEIVPYFFGEEANIYNLKYANSKSRDAE